MDTLELPRPTANCHRSNRVQALYGLLQRRSISPLSCTTIRMPHCAPERCQYVLANQQARFDSEYVGIERQLCSMVISTWQRKHWYGPCYSESRQHILYKNTHLRSSHSTNQDDFRCTTLRRRGHTPSSTNLPAYQPATAGEYRLPSSSAPSRSPPSPAPASPSS